MKRRNPRGRPKMFERRILLPLAEGMLADIDAVVETDETRVDMIRAAIEREIEHRVRAVRR